MYSPTVLLPQGRDIRPVEASALLLQKRIVFYGEEVSSESANALIQQLLILEQDDRKAPVTLYINSPGGSIVDGLGIYDTIQKLACPVHAVVCGMAASMGAIILAGCERGERAIMPHGEVLLHQPLGGARGPATDVKITAERILRMKQMLYEILAERCGQPYDKIAEDCDRDHWLEPPQAVEYGICDKVL